jgi:hypothetical protein
MGRYQEAIWPLEDAVRFDENHSMAWYRLGLGYAATLRLEDADRAFDASLSLFPQHCSVQLAKGINLHNLSRRTAAIERICRSMTPDTSSFDLTASEKEEAEHALSQMGVDPSRCRQYWVQESDDPQLTAP